MQATSYQGRANIVYIQVYQMLQRHTMKYQKALQLPERLGIGRRMSKCTTIRTIRDTIARYLSIPSTFPQEVLYDIIGESFFDQNIDRVISQLSHIQRIFTCTFYHFTRSEERRV